MADDVHTYTYVVTGYGVTEGIIPQLLTVLQKYSGNAIKNVTFRDITPSGTGTFSFQWGSVVLASTIREVFSEVGVTVTDVEVE